MRFVRIDSVLLDSSVGDFYLVAGCFVERNIVVVERRKVVLEAKLQPHRESEDSRITPHHPEVRNPGGDQQGSFFRSKDFVTK